MKQTRKRKCQTRKYKGGNRWATWMQGLKQKETEKDPFLLALMQQALENNKKQKNTRKKQKETRTSAEAMIKKIQEENNNNKNNTWDPENKKNK
jgi:ribosomal protein L17